ncbi:MAG TPA: thioredoxin family protein [Ginsengibacter sp.]
MIKLFFAIALFLSPTLMPSPWMTNLDKAKQVAKNEHKLILLNFSGSDWCIPCMKLRADIFGSNNFMKYAKDNLILVNADFPRENKNQISKQQQKK